MIRARCISCGEEWMSHPAAQWTPYCGACAYAYEQIAKERLAKADEILDRPLAYYDGKPGMFVSTRDALRFIGVVFVGCAVLVSIIAWLAL